MTQSRRPPKPGDVADLDTVGSGNVIEPGAMRPTLAGLPRAHGGLPDPDLARNVGLALVEPFSSLLQQRADGHTKSIDEFYGKRKSQASPTIDRTINLARSHVIVTNAHRRKDDPKVGFDDKWAEALAVAREKAGLSQQQLADAIGTSQNSISLMESSGDKRVRASHDVLPACRRLGLAPPLYLASDLQKRWLSVGAEFEKNDLPQFVATLELLEASRKGPRSTNQTPTQATKQNKPMRGQRTGISVQNDPEKTAAIRDPDQLPGEPVARRKKKPA